MRTPARGLRFDPTDLELICYLTDKVWGCPNPGQGLIIDDVDVYASSPDLLYSAYFFTCDGDGKLICYTPIKYRKPPHRDRSTPDGHWKSTNGKVQIKDGVGNPIGYVQRFSYRYGPRGSVGSKWIMKEYTLHAKSPQNANSPQNVALCVIYSSRNKERASSLQPIQNQSSLSYNASSQGDLSNFSSATHGISISYSSGVGAGSGSENVDDPLYFDSSWQGFPSFDDGSLPSLSEFPELPDNGFPSFAEPVASLRRYLSFPDQREDTPSHPDPGTDVVTPAPGME